MQNPNLEDSERQPCEIYSRVMGYIRPIVNFNIGKKQEYRDRKPFFMPSSAAPSTACTPSGA